MTSNKHLKQLVRARAARTGESYTAARRHVLARRTTVDLTPAFQIDAHGRHGQTVTFSADGTLLASGGQDAAVRVWDAAAGTAMFALEGHAASVNDVLLLDDATAVSASSDRTMRLWDLRSRAATATLQAHRDAVVCLAVSCPGTVVSSGYDGRLCWWDVATGKLVHEVRGTLGRVADIAVVPSTGHLLAGTGPHIVVCDGDSGDEIARIDTGATAVTGLAVSPDGDVIAAAGHDGTVTFWAAPDWEPLRRLDIGVRPMAVDISADGRLLAVAWDHHIGVWSTDGEAPAATVPLPIKGVYAVAFSPDGTRLAQTGADGRVRCWRLR
jgi:WD40 repeat protein